MRHIDIAEALTNIGDSYSFGHLGGYINDLTFLVCTNFEFHVLLFSLKRSKLVRDFCSASFCYVHWHPGFLHQRLREEGRVYPVPIATLTDNFMGFFPKVGNKIVDVLM